MLISHNEDLQFMCPFLYVQNIRAECYKPDIKDLFTNVTYSKGWLKKCCAPIKEDMVSCPFYIDFLFITLLHCIGTVPVTMNLDLVF